MSQFREITSAALKEHMRDYVNNHLQQAMQRIGNDADSEERAEPPAEVENDIEAEGNGEMGRDEREAFLIIKAIARKSVDVRRLSLHRGRSYCVVLLDNQKRRRLCRLRFGRRKKRVEIPLAEPKVVSIESLDDIYSLEEDLRTMAQELAAE